MTRAQIRLKADIRKAVQARYSHRIRFEVVTRYTVAGDTCDNYGLAAPGSDRHDSYPFRDLNLAGWPPSFVLELDISENHLTEFENELIESIFVTVQDGKIQGIGRQALKMIA